MNPDTLDIRPGDIVLDVGSGSNPNPKATVLLDLYLKDSSHRSFEMLKRDERPLINATVEALPFRDKSIDYVICNHVLEHVDEPRKACRELQRVAKRGYIECPNPFLEQGYYVVSNGKSYWTKHKWYVWNPSQSPYAAEKREISYILIFQKRSDNIYCTCRFAHIIHQFYEDMKIHSNLFKKRFKTESESNIVDKIMELFTPNIHHTIFHWDNHFETFIYTSQEDPFRKGGEL